MGKTAYEKGMKTRRKVLGDEWVDRAERTKTSFNAEFQDLITRYAWNEIWNRKGLDHRTRRMLVITAMVALGRWEEYQLHVRAAAGDVVAVLDRLRIERAHWVGLSMGGMVGQAFALAHGDRLGRLVLANTTSSYGADGRQMWEARAKAVEEGGMAAITELAMTRYFSDEFRARQPGAVDRIRRRFLATDPRGYIGCCDAIRDLDFTSRLAAIKARTLAIAGGKDVGTPPAMSEAMAAKIRGARMAVIAGAAHLSAVENPDAFATLVLDFLLKD